MAKLQKSSRLQLSLLKLSVLPAVVMGVLSIFIGLQTVKQSMIDDVEATLRGVCGETEDMLFDMFPEGGYKIVGDEYLVGNRNLREATDSIDKIKENFSTEVTVFLSNERAITTIVDDNGKRIVGTVQDDKEIIRKVSAGGTYTSDDVKIRDEDYYGMYVPLIDNDKVVGMIFAGISKKNFTEIISDYFVEIILLTGILLIFITCYVSIYAKDMADVLGKIKEYLGSLAMRQTSDAEMEETVLERNDEIGDLGRYAVEIGTRLKRIIGHDPLTNLRNRRAGTQSLEKMAEEAACHQSEFTVVMCDIDFFKSINDKYGHDVGDKVLKGTSEIFVKHCDNNGVSIRWGGEEFVLGLKLGLDDTLTLIERIRKDIKKRKYSAGEEKFGITLTFGVETYEDGTDEKAMILAADEKLYRGKMNGRNCVVYQDEHEENKNNE